MRAATRANPRFTFGTGKVGDLAAYSSGIILAVAAIMIAWESLTRLVQPVPIAFGQAICLARWSRAFRGDRRDVTRRATDAGELKVALKARYPLAHLTVEVLATAPRDGAGSAPRGS